MSLSDKLAWADALSDPRFRASLDEGLADVKAGRTRLPEWRRRMLERLAEKGRVAEKALDR